MRQLLHTLFMLFDVEDTFSTDCQIALSSPIKDYEDAIMVQTAIRTGADCIITRNLRDYKLAPLPIFSPKEFLKKITEEKASEE